MKLKHLFKLVIVCVLFFILSAVSARAEYVFLRDGSIIKGKILRETATKIFFRTAEGQNRIYGRGAILRLQYTNIYMGKRFVRLSDGTSFEAFLVDEDQNTYTFRKDIKSTQEFTIKREMVLFMSRSNPTGLRGQVYSDRVKLYWYPPYRKPRRYNIYLKKKEKDAKYVLTGSTRSPGYTVKNLDRKTGYYLKVTAIDREGVESVPSNEIIVKTNAPPKSPTGVKVTKRITEKLKMNVDISWQAAIDLDGTVEKYTVYQEIDKEKKKIGDSTVTHYTVRDLDSDKVYRFAIAAVDNDGGKSPAVEISTKQSTIQVTAMGSYLYPLMNLSGIVHSMWGVSLRVSLHNMPLQHMAFGIEGGYYSPIKTIEEGADLTIAPLMVSFGYSFNLLPWFSLTPEVLAGGAFVKLSNRAGKSYVFLYSGSPSSIPLATYLFQGTTMQFEPMAAAGLKIRFKTGRWIDLGADVRYSMIIEKGDPIGFMTFSLFMAVKF